VIETNCAEEYVYYAGLLSMMRKYYKYSIFFIFGSLIIGCSSKANTYKQEAEAFCNVQNPENWLDYKNTGSYFDFQDELVKRISKVVVSEEFRDIFKKLSEDDSRPDAYTFYKTEIEKLTGEEWNCPYAKDFYSVEWKSEHITPGQPTSAASDDETEELVIRLEQNGDYIINSEKVAAQDSEKIDQLLKEFLNKKSKVKIITADGVSKEQLLEAMGKLSHLGVTNVTIVTQGANPPKLD
jgi:hypothetical protein